MKGLPLEALNSAHDSAHLRQADDGEVGRQALLLSQDDATATASQLRCRLLVPLCCVTAEAEAGVVGGIFPVGSKLPLGLVLHLWRDAGLTDSVRIVFGLRPSRRHQQRQGGSGNQQFAHDNLS